MRRGYISLGKTGMNCYYFYFRITWRPWFELYIRFKDGSNKTPSLAEQYKLLSFLIFIEPF